MSVKRSKGLGRGLEALLGEDRASLISAEPTGSEPGSTRLPSSLPLSLLQAGKYQPRTRMDEGALNDLAQSIKEQGIMQPILVRPLADQRYEIIAGERRFRAAQLAGLQEVPVLVREVADEHAAVMALVENIQREDLNPLEEAQGVQRLLNEFDMTHELAAQAIGRSRSATSNLLRLLQLAEPVQTMLLAGDLDMGHARALLALDGATQIQLAHHVVAKRLSVREAEKLVTQHLPETSARSKRAGQVPVQQKARDVTRLEESLSDYLGTAVEIKANKKQRGQLIIHFQDWEHLNTLIERQGLSSLVDV